MPPSRESRAARPRNPRGARTCARPAARAIAGDTGIAGVRARRARSPAGDPAGRHRSTPPSKPGERRARGCGRVFGPRGSPGRARRRSRRPRGSRPDGSRARKDGCSAAPRRRAPLAAVPVRSGAVPPREVARRVASGHHGGGSVFRRRAELEVRRRRLATRPAACRHGWRVLVVRREVARCRWSLHGVPSRRGGSTDARKRRAIERCAVESAGCARRRGRAG